MKESVSIKDIVVLDEIQVRVALNPLSGDDLNSLCDHIGELGCDAQVKKFTDAMLDRLGNKKESRSNTLSIYRKLVQNALEDRATLIKLAEAEFKSNYPETKTRVMNLTPYDPDLEPVLFSEGLNVGSLNVRIVAQRAGISLKPIGL